VGVRGHCRRFEVSPSPQPSQPKSDLSDFGQPLRRPNSGKPEFGCAKNAEREQTEHAALLIASHRNALKDVDGPAKPGHGEAISSEML
jgi:hypothetical protein